MNRGNRPDVTAAAKSFAIANPDATAGRIRKALVSQGIPNRQITQGVVQYARQLGRKAVTNGHTHIHSNGTAATLNIDEVQQCSMELVASLRRYGKAVFAKSTEFVSQLGIDRTAPVS